MPQLLRFNGKSLYFHPRLTDNRGRPLTVDALGVTDRFLAARPGAEFSAGRDRRLVRYAQDVVGMGLKKEPDIDRNPYNFVPWIGDKPSRAEDPLDATHDRMRNGRLSGRIAVIFTARTPIFVPAGQLPASDPSPGETSGHILDFFHCWDGVCRRYAIPGASVKGAVRSIFEALTNSRAGVTDDATLGRAAGTALRRRPLAGRALRTHPPLYRRRSSRLYKILTMPDDDGPGTVVECAYALCDEDGTPCETRPYAERRKHETGYQNDHNDIKERPWRANLFWVEPDRHRHGPKKVIRFHPRGKSQTLELSQQTVCRFRSMKGHPQLQDHPKNAFAASRNFYQKPLPRPVPARPPDYSEIEQDLFRLKPGDIVFGIPKNGELHCFGKNVNFLWPGSSSPLGLMGPPDAAGRGAFAARDPAGQRLCDSDPAEAVFGFAGKHAGDGHPFRGRVRFGTFWGPCVTEPKPDPVRLMSLTAPSGTKAKSRPLYLEPANGGQSADYDGDAKLRGRKFYWHQRGTDKGKLPGVHLLEALRGAVPEGWEQEATSQLPARIRPLPACTRFSGVIDFNNLTAAELGALLASIEPGLAFGSTRSVAPEGEEAPAYGIKIGKGKPRGLGSVQASIELHLKTQPAERYRCLDARLSVEEKDIACYVTAYKRRSEGEHGRPWDDLDTAKALKALLRIPDRPSVRVYPPQFAMYGWMPEVNDADGNPRGERPKAMTPAYKLTGP